MAQLFQPSRQATPNRDLIINEILDAVMELSQTHTGALLILETNAPIDERNCLVPGVKLDAFVSKELLQTVFQPTTRLHDGAVLIRASRIVAAGALLPLTDRTAPRQLGARHRAALEFTEQIDNCLCIVVSGETGFIAVAEKGILNRPLTSSKLQELLRARLF